MSDNKFVTADPQFGNAKVLRPFPTYKTVYGGQPHNYFIGLFEDGVALDSQAGKPGYSQRLCRGLPVPLGARVCFWLPVSGEGARGGNIYQYSIIWRFRNLHDFRVTRSPYHIPKQSGGVSDTTPGIAGSRVIIPASMHSSSYSSSKPTATYATNSDVSLYPEFITPSGYAPFDMLNPDGNMSIVQQGLSDPETAGAGEPPNFSPGWELFETQAMGDELIMAVARTSNTITSPTWQFNGANDPDHLFSLFWDSSPYSGVYALVGSAP
jgi:hypothetical protein